MVEVVSVNPGAVDVFKLHVTDALAVVIANTTIDENITNFLIFSPLAFFVLLICEYLMEIHKNFLIMI